MLPLILRNLKAVGHPVWCLAVFLLLGCLLGCPQHASKTTHDQKQSRSQQSIGSNRDDPPGTPTTSSKSVQSGQEASVNSFDPDSATKPSDAIWNRLHAELIQNPNDASLHLAAGQVAHRLGEHKKGIALTHEAVKLAGKSEPELIQAAAQQAYNHNFFFDAIEILTKLRIANLASPTQSRAIAELCRDVGLENRYLELSRQLIRERNFDLVLLAGCLCPEDSRLGANQDILDIVDAFPHDLRPLVCEARDKLDWNKLEESLNVLERILRTHSNDPEALLTLGQLSALSGDRTRLLRWLRNVSDELVTRWEYWDLLGRYSELDGNDTIAISSYHRAHQLDPNRIHPVSRLMAVLDLVAPDASEKSQGINESYSQNDLVQLQEECRAHFDLLISIRELLSELKDIEDYRSQRIAIEIAKNLDALGRLWEAEAWAAIAIGIQEDPITSPNVIRKRIVSQLRGNTPWRINRWSKLGKINLQPPSASQIARYLKTNADLAAGSNGSGINVYDAPPHVAIQMKNEAVQRGLTYFGYPAKDLDSKGVALQETLGCGVAIIDYDLDGWPDVYAASGGGTPFESNSRAGALFRNSEGRFSFATERASLGDTGYTLGLCCGDINADGFPDLLSCNIGMNRLFVNNGDGTFSDATARIGLEGHKEWSTSAAFADMDQDGLTDLIVLNYCAGEEYLSRECRAEGVGHLSPCRPTNFPAALDRIYKQSELGQLLDHRDKWSFVPSNPGRGLGIIVGSLDQIPGIDVYIANDMTDNHYWTVQEKGRFGLKESAVLYGLARDGKSNAQASMGMAVDDFDNDLRLDFYITNYQNEPNILLTQTTKNQWVDKTSVSGTAEASHRLVGFGCQASDLDSNGTAEIAITNGHVDNIDEGSEYFQPFQIFHSELSSNSISEGVFKLLSEDSLDHYGEELHIGRAMAVVDADNDGLEDLVITHQSEPIALLMNDTTTPYHWVSLRLVGVQSDRDAIGATIELEFDSGRKIHPIVGGNGYLCSNQIERRWGVGANELIKKLRVTWPSGAQQEFQNVSADQTWMLIEGQSELFALGI